MTPAQREAVEAFEKYGSKQKAADVLGISRSALRDRLAHAKKYLEADDSIKSAMNEVGMRDIDLLHSGWIKTEGASLYFQMPGADPVDLMAEVRTAFEGITPAPIMPAPESSLADLCTVYPLMDVHLGMHAWGRETGQEDYSLKHAEADMRHALAKIMRLTPGSEQAILIIGGDFFHADDNTAQTPASRHNLDVDSRHWKVLDVGIRLVSDCIATLLSKHSRLHVRVLRGNHDEHSHLVLSFALAEKFANDPRLTVEKEPFDLFMFEWGRTSIFAHHGDKGNPQQLVNLISDICPFWSSTRHRYCFTGHVHHDKVKDLGPVRWHSLRAFAPADNYGAKFGPRRAIQSITFHKIDGRVQENADPIERAA